MTSCEFIYLMSFDLSRKEAFVWKRNRVSCGIFSGCRTSVA